MIDTTNRKRHIVRLVDKSLNFGRQQIGSFARQVAPYATVLDMGAGWGFDLSAARRACPSARLLGVEVDPQYIDHLARHQIVPLALNIERDPLPLQTESIDLVIMNQILEHTKEVFWILHEVTRVLTVGGSLIIGVPNLASLHNRLLLALGKQPTCIQTNSAHVRGFTLPGLTIFLDACFPEGYALTDFQGGNFYPFPSLLARPLAARYPSMAVSIFLLLRKQIPYSREFLDYPVEQQLQTNFFVDHSASRV